MMATTEDACLLLIDPDVSITAELVPLAGLLAEQPD